MKNKKADETMNKRKLIVFLIIVCMVLVADVAFLGSLLRQEKPNGDVMSASDAYEAISIFNEYGDVQLAVVPTKPPVHGQEEPLSDESVQKLTPSDAAEVTQPQEQNAATESTQAVPPQAEEQEDLAFVIKNIEEAMAYLRNAQTYTAVKNQTGNAEILELSISWLRKPGEMIINSIIQSIKPLIYEFENGYAVDPKSKENVTPFDVLPPSGEAFSIDPAGVTGYEITKNEDATTTYSVWIQEETCALEEHPKYHSTCMGYLKLEQFDLKGVKITSGTVIYHEGAFHMTVDENGVPVKLHASLPMTGSGEGELGIKASASLTGYLEDTWIFTW